MRVAGLLFFICRLRCRWCAIAPVLQLAGVKEAANARLTRVVAGSTYSERLWTLLRSSDYDMGVPRAGLAYYVTGSRAKDVAKPSGDLGTWWQEDGFQGIWAAPLYVQVTRKSLLE